MKLAAIALFGGACLVVHATPAGALDACATPLRVQAYLDEHPSWSIVRLQDLHLDDQAFWREGAHANKCPGLAELDFFGDGLPAYGVALRRTQSGVVEEQVLVLRGGPGGRELVLVRPYTVTIPAVVYSVGPGVVDAWDGTRRVRVKGPSLVVEQMEAWAEQFYFDGKRIRRIRISD